MLIQVPNLNCRINYLERETKSDQVMIVTNLVPKVSSQLTGEGGPDPDPPCLKRRKAETMASSLPSILKRGGDGHDHIPPLLLERHGKGQGHLPTFLLGVGRR